MIGSWMKTITKIGKKGKKKEEKGMLVKKDARKKRADVYCFCNGVSINVYARCSPLIKLIGFKIESNKPVLI